MNVEKITNLEDLIPLGEGSRIIDQKIKRLTAPGENYGSLMLSVDITVKTTNSIEVVHAVAKMVPPNELLQQVFQTQITFRNEIGFYKNIIPTLRNFQREQGVEKVVDFFPEYIGSRINLTGTADKVDSDAVILLENLKISAYKNVDRTVGFDLETTKMIINDLAHLHAVPIALKMKKPEVFQKEIKPYLHTLEPPKGENEFSEKLLTLIGCIDECRPYFDRVKATIEGRVAPEVREPFGTISHNDFWVNNTMVKFEEGKPVKNKMVDFQGCDYGSPAKDLLFFLFTSVQNRILEKHCDDLIKLYHEKFVRILKELDCISEKFSYENFIQEIEFTARAEFHHIVGMYFPIFMPKDKTTELDKFQFEDILKSAAAPSKEHIAKLALTIKEFAKRKWI